MPTSHAGVPALAAGQPKPGRSDSGNGPGSKRRASTPRCPTTASWSDGAGVSSAVGIGPTRSAPGAGAAMSGGAATTGARAGGGDAEGFASAIALAGGGGATGGTGGWARADALHPTAPTASVAIRASTRYVPLPTRQMVGCALGVAGSHE